MEDCGVLDLGNKKGFEFSNFSKDQIDSFTEELYSYIKHYKHRYNLLDPEERKIDNQIENFLSVLDILMDSQELNKFLMKESKTFDRTNNNFVVEDISY